MYLCSPSNEPRDDVNSHLQTVPQAYQSFCALPSLVKNRGYKSILCAICRRFYNFSN